MRKTPAYIAAYVRRVLRDGGSAPHSAEVQRFFKEEIQSRGWYTAELRKVAARVRRAVLNDAGPEFLLAVADRLFRGRVLEEKVFAVFLLERSAAEFGDREFKLFEGWLGRVSSWADHDALVHYLVAPLVAAKPRRVVRVFRWAKSPNRWMRRAACVAMIRATREQKCFSEIVQLSNRLLEDEDDMVQKGLGWLLRETAKASPAPAMRYLLEIRKHAPRPVLRTACETLSRDMRERILGVPHRRARAAGAQ